MTDRPRMAIIDPNVLSVLGLKQILQQVIPIMEVHAFATLDEMRSNAPDSYFHYFVAQSVVILNRQFFLERRHKTIVLTMGHDASTHPVGFHSLNVNVSEEQLVRSLLQLEQRAHAHGKNFPSNVKAAHSHALTAREKEVLVLIVEGNINKEIADRLNIGLTTVISHRKNIMEKLGAKSVSALTIYAVMNGYVDINKI
ncbi:helix-turn-helix transcriptional regulator [Hallella colorans]|uniref:helix-turn-helix transcriptional regulator n=1 Tax=Hallella colorans TaxID=1703337 RepID=UPI00248E5A3A|nr:LuxR C-terminal-related transcriptional regulator [Hallella colorans]